MKKLTLIPILIFLSLGLSNAQETKGWETPMQEVKFDSGNLEDATLKVDPGIRYADLFQPERKYRLYFNFNRGMLKQARIVDQETNLEIAKGRGSYFLGNGRIEFVGGETYKLKRKQNRNGYEIIGPYGTLFKVENQAIIPVKTLNEKDFLVQALFVFERIKKTQTPPTDVIIYSAPVTYQKK